MSRSRAKHSITKMVRGDHKKSWKKWKKMIHHLNRARSKTQLRHGEEPMDKYLPLCYIDFDFCKTYYSKKDLEEFSKVMRK